MYNEPMYLRKIVVVHKANVHLFRLSQYVWVHLKKGQFLIISSKNKRNFLLTVRNQLFQFKLISFIS